MRSTTFDEEDLVRTCKELDYTIKKGRHLFLACYKCKLLFKVIDWPDIDDYRKTVCFCYRCGRRLNYHRYALCPICKEYVISNPCNRPKYCSRQCSWIGAAKKRMRRINVTCFICAKPMTRRRAWSRHHIFSLCEDRICRRIFVQSVISPILTVYSPDLLKAMMSFTKTIDCVFPGCSESRDKSMRNPWNVCEKHLKRIKNCLRQKRNNREKILFEQGFSSTQIRR